MKLDKIAFRTKHIQLKKDGSIPLSNDAPYDFEDGDTNRFKELKAFPKVPYTHEQILRAMKSLHKMIEKQAENYGKGKLYKAGIVEAVDENEADAELIQQCYDLLKHLNDNKDEAGMQLFMSIVSDIIDFSDEDPTDDPAEETTDVKKIAESEQIPEADAYGGVLIHDGKVLLRNQQIILVDMYGLLLRVALMKVKTQKP